MFSLKNQQVQRILPNGASCNHFKVINGLSYGAVGVGFHFYPYSKECEKSVWNKLIFANQHSKILECTQSIVKQTTTYFRISFNELPI